MAVVAAALRMARLHVGYAHRTSFAKVEVEAAKHPPVQAIKSHVPRPLPGYYRALATRFVSPQESGRRAAASIGVGDSRPASPRWLIDFIKEEGVQRIRESLFQM